MGFDKFWRSDIHTKRIFQHQYLTITRQRRPNPNSRCLDILGDLTRQTLNHPLKNKSKGTSRTDRPSISFIPGPAIGIAALGLKSPHSMARLRCQAYTSHHWNTALGQKPMVSAMQAPPSSFTAPQPVSFITHAAFRNAICGLSA